MVMSELQSLISVIEAKKASFTLEELANVWSSSIQDIVNLVEHGYLQCFIYLDDIRIEHGSLYHDENDDTLFEIHERYENITGFMPIRAEDCKSTTVRENFYNFVESY